MKLIPVNYYGFTAMDRRFSSPMLPWIVSEIRKRDFCDKLSLGVEDGILQAYNPDFELQFSHKIWQVTRFSQADQDPTTFLYLMRDDNDSTLYCYLFQAQKTADVLHVIDRLLDPMLLNPIPSPTALDFLQSYPNWKIGSLKISNFLKRIQFYDKEKLFEKPGIFTFFIPIDSKSHHHHFQDIDSYIIDGHVVPNNVLFTRPAPKNFVFETAANDDYVNILVAMVQQNGRDYVRSYRVLGSGDYKKREVLAEVVKGNIPVTNGVVHLISRPLAVFERELKPFPYLPVWYKVSADPELNITYQVIRNSRVGHILRKSSVFFTFFAPRDRSWENYLGYSNDDLGDVLERHLIVSQAGFYTMDKLLFKANGTILETLGGSLKLRAVYTNGSFFLVWGQKWYRVYRPDYHCSDGIVHIIDGVFTAPRPITTTTQPPESSSLWNFLKKLVT